MRRSLHEHVRTVVLGFLFITICTVSVSAQLSSPKIVGPQNNDRTNRTPTLHRQQLNNATWYRVWINNKTQGTNHLKKWVKGSNSWTIPESQELNPDDEYSLWVAGWNSSDKLGPWSQQRDFRAGTVEYLSVGAPGFGTIRGSSLLKNNLIMEHNSQDPLVDAETNIHLPQGAKILEVTSQWQDNDPDANAEIYIQQIALFGSQQGNIVNVDTSGSSGTDDTTTSSTTGSDAIIDNSAMDYQLRVEFPSSGNDADIRVYKVIIKYVK